VNQFGPLSSPQLHATEASEETRIPQAPLSIPAEEWAQRQAALKNKAA
jgi:hypothetical protein